jgi:outer membrane murein-binding lipoprotein Lpp
MKRSVFRVWLALLVGTLVLFQVAQSQQRRRTSRRVTHPVRPQPTPDSDEPSVVSTADDQQNNTNAQHSTPHTTKNTQTENEQLRGTVKSLSSEVEQLSGQLNQMKADQRAMFDLERLTRAEQRAEDLRTQLREITDKQLQYQERLAEIDYESQPDSIQRRAALVGTLDPSAVRDAIQQSLERERTRIQKQLDLLETSRTHLEAAITTADAEVEKLRQRVDAADQEQANAPATGAPATPANTNTNATPQPSPSPQAQPPI